MGKDLDRLAVHVAEERFVVGLGRSAGGVDAAVVEHGGAIGVGRGEGQVVEDDDHRVPGGRALAAQAQDQFLVA